MLSFTFLNWTSTNKKFNFHFVRFIDFIIIFFHEINILYFTLYLLEILFSNFRVPTIFRILFQFFRNFTKSSVTILIKVLNLLT